MFNFRTVISPAIVCICLLIPDAVQSQNPPGHPQTSSRLRVTVALVEHPIGTDANAVIVTSSDGVTPDVIALSTDQATPEGLSAAVYTLLVILETNNDSRGKRFRVNSASVPSNWQQRAIPAATPFVNRLPTAPWRVVPGI